MSKLNTDAKFYFSHQNSQLINSTKEPIRRFQKKQHQEVNNINRMLKNQKPSDPIGQEGFYMVAGAGFEPTTFGL
jgi:phage-related tail protein